MEHVWHQDSKQYERKQKYWQSDIKQNHEDCLRLERIFRHRCNGEWVLHAGRFHLRRSEAITRATKLPTPPVAKQPHQPSDQVAHLWSVQNSRISHKRKFKLHPTNYLKSTPHPRYRLGSRPGTNKIGM